MDSTWLRGFVGPALALPLVARAADLPVTYSVQEKPLKTAITGTPLTFTLYSDTACSQQVYQATVPIQNVTLISTQFTNLLRVVVSRAAPRAGLPPLRLSRRHALSPCARRMGT